MYKQLSFVVSVFLCVLLLTGCPMLAQGGLTESDFELVSLNGFDPEDNARDLNDYAWSLEYFRADGAEEGFVYSGTGNNLIGLVFETISSLANEGMPNPETVQTLPPEIRRYRPELGSTAWERVFDYREVEAEGEFTTTGFRFLEAFRGADEVNRLYAGTLGADAALWRTATGEPGSWELFWEAGEPGSIRWMEEHRGLLYLAFTSASPSNPVGKVFATDGTSVWNVIDDGFGSPLNEGIVSLASFNGFLYAGTSNPSEGCEVWKFAGPDGAAPELIVDNGGPAFVNEAFATPFVFQRRLYFGTQINPFGSITAGFKAADLIRINPDDTWETVVGPGGISGFDSGFNNKLNIYIWQMEKHEGWLYASTYDQLSALFNVIENLDQLFLAISGNLKREANFIEEAGNAGADLYKTQDGVVWVPVTITGFGDVGNYGIRSMLSQDGVLFAGTANPFDGCEVWAGERMPDAAE